MKYDLEIVIWCSAVSVSEGERCKDTICWHQRSTDPSRSDVSLPRVVHGMRCWQVILIHDTWLATERSNRTSDPESKRPILTPAESTFKVFSVIEKNGSNDEYVVRGMAS